MRLIPSDQTRARMRVRDKTCVSTVWVRFVTVALSGCAIAALSWSAVQHRLLNVDRPYANFYFWALAPLVFSVCWCFINILFALIVRRPLHPVISLITDFIAFGSILTFGILIHFKISGRAQVEDCGLDDCTARLHKLHIVERAGEIISLIAAGFEFLIFVLSAVGCFTHRFEGLTPDRRVQWKGASRGPTGRQHSYNNTGIRSGPGRLSQASTIANDRAMAEKKGEPQPIDIAAGFERDDPWMASYGNDPAVLDYEKYDNIDLEDHEVDEKALQNGKHSSSSSRSLGKSKPSPIFISPTRASNKVATRGTALDARP